MMHELIETEGGFVDPGEVVAVKAPDPDGTIEVLMREGRMLAVHVKPRHERRELAKLDHVISGKLGKFTYTTISDEEYEREAAAVPEFEQAKRMRAENEDAVQDYYRDLVRRVNEARALPAQRSPMELLSIGTWEAGA